ncbi:hypothetical protein ElyMa_001117200 [Elysia marginata]|uniref:C2H2-type domain-containing protein n=1 Tax=Elysia marginata TaxID=1093978 RepID=A0AAV4HWZ2_9GAST|nr:hypothetical protein ElyMa_001117200 [Elysia marginata]
MCEKNPGHDNFLSPQEFLDTFITRLESEEKYELYKSLIDFTVRLRMHCTSLDRPDDDAFADYRGTPRMRMGTGFIRRVQQLKQSEPCCCDECHGKVPMNQLGLEVHTARHIVFNMEEAKRTKVDLFYDDDSCLSNGRMKSVWVMGMFESQSDKEWCNMWCVTCDDGLG